MRPAHTGQMSEIELPPLCDDRIRSQAECVKVELTLPTPSSAPTTSSIDRRLLRPISEAWHLNAVRLLTQPVPAPAAVVASKGITGTLKPKPKTKRNTTTKLITLSCLLTIVAAVGAKGCVHHVAYDETTVRLLEAAPFSGFFKAGPSVRPGTDGLEPFDVNQANTQQILEHGMLSVIPFDRNSPHLLHWPSFDDIPIDHHVNRTWHSWHITALCETKHNMLKAPSNLAGPHNHAWVVFFLRKSREQEAFCASVALNIYHDAYRRTMRGDSDTMLGFCDS